MMLGITEADGFAISMIAILGLSFSFVFVILATIVIRARRHGGEDDEGEDHSKDPSALPAGEPAGKERREAWEKNADWWKGGR